MIYRLIHNPDYFKYKAGQRPEHMDQKVFYMEGHTYDRSIAHINRIVYQIQKDWPDIKPEDMGVYELRESDSRSRKNQTAVAIDVPVDYVAAHLDEFE